MFNRVAIEILNTASDQYSLYIQFKSVYNLLSINSFPFHLARVPLVVSSFNSFSLLRKTIFLEFFNDINRLF